MSEAGSFDADWLALRGPADAAARSTTLTQRLADALVDDSGRPARLVDLAAGTGANLRYLAPRLGAAGVAAQSWRLVDYDPRLLAAGVEACRDWAERGGLAFTDRTGGFRIDGDGWHAEAQCACADLSSGLDALPVEAGAAIVMTALLDLVSRDWLAGLVRLVDRAGGPLLATLTDDGLLGFAPREPFDRVVARLFEAHQRRDKGFGPALGTGATAVLAGLLRDAGMAPKTRRSAWLLGGPAAGLAVHTLQARTVEGIAGAAIEQDPSQAPTIETWLRRRLDEAAAGRLRLLVGHRDLFAQPKPSGGPTP